MSRADYDVYRRIKHAAALLTDRFGVARQLSVQVAPGVHRAIIDVSSGGQISAVLMHMARHDPIPQDHRLVLDIGANDGFQGSHSFNLIQLGWMAALVEPNPMAYQEILANVGRRGLGGREARVVVRNVAVTVAADGRAPFFVEGWRHTASSLVERSGEGHRIEVQTVSVPALLADLEQEFCRRGLISEFPLELGLMSLDVEGTDFEVLKAFFGQRIRPRYLLVEARGDVECCDRIVSPYGYERLTRFHADALYFRTGSAAEVVRSIAPTTRAT